MNDAQVKHMLDRFLSYRFPDDIQPDGGLSIRRVFNEGTPHEFKATPSGTNLLNATQAEAMIRHMLEGLPALGDGWRDIDSAPRDGRDVLVHTLHGLRRVAFWDEARGGLWSLWPGREPAQPTHWRPLPNPPGAKP